MTTPNLTSSAIAETQERGENAILQFGTSRFLLAHADLFVSEAHARGEAIGRITLVQTTGSADSARRIEALSSGRPYPVRVRGLSKGETVDVTCQSDAVARALMARDDWRSVRRAAVAARVILSNTGDRGFELESADTADSIADRTIPPRSFPAKIAALLRERFEQAPEALLSIYPCELINRNGDRLKAIVRELAAEWRFPSDFDHYLDRSCRFANSLVDRIVSEPIEPVGAVAEPYALWAVERQEGLTLPCTHPAIVLTDDLARYEDLKLHILNLGHTVLAELWLSGAHERVSTVREIMDDLASRATLEHVWKDEVLPIFAAHDLETQATHYIDEVRERFLNPFLAHRLSDIAANHREKKRRRILPIVERGRSIAGSLGQPLLIAMLETHHG